MSIYQILEVHPDSAWFDDKLEGTIIKADTPPHPWNVSTPGLAGFVSIDRAEMLNTKSASWQGDCLPKDMALFACKLRRLFK